MINLEIDSESHAAQQLEPVVEMYPAGFDFCESRRGAALNIEKSSRFRSQSAARLCSVNLLRWAVKKSLCLNIQGRRKRLTPVSVSKIIFMALVFAGKYVHNMPIQF